MVLAGKIDWGYFGGEFSALYAEDGRPGIATRRMVGLRILKHIYGLSDEEVCERWLETIVFKILYGRHLRPA